MLDALAALEGLDDFEVIVVDDGSSDGTGALADALVTRFPSVRAIHHPHNRGVGAAYQSALDAARMEYFGWIGGDHEITLDSLRNILQAIGSAEIVIPFHATPWKRTRFRRLLTWLCTNELNLLFGYQLHYYQGPAIYTTAMARGLSTSTSNFFFATEKLLQALDKGSTWTEVGLEHQERAHGQSKAVAWRNMLNAEKTILRAWWYLRVRSHKGGSHAASARSASSEAAPEAPGGIRP